MNRVLAIFLIISICLGTFTACNGNEDIEKRDEAARTAVLDEFMKLSEIPRESGNVKEISSYLRSWAKENGFKVIRDKSYNIIIDKPAAKGFEDAPTTILQCHMDMNVKIAEGVVFDPASDPIKIINDGEKLMADGTSLGADNGIGIATAQYILKNAMNHGPIRVIFTSDEETTMKGARNLDPKHLKGDYLINLDWQSDTSLCISSAGTTSHSMFRDITWAKPKNSLAFQIAISGLNGGDSIQNIDDGGANAIKVIGETLAMVQGEGILFELAAFRAIPSY